MEKKIKKYSKTGWILSTLLLTIIIAVISAPKILQLEPCKNYIVKLIAKNLESKISIKNIKLSWLGPQTLEKVSFHNPSVDFTLDSYTINTSILNFFHNLGLQKNNIPSNLIIKNGNINLHNPELPPADFSNVNLTLHKNFLNNEIEITTTGQTKENEICGDFAINAIIHANHYLISANFKNFPVVIVDRFMYSDKRFFSEILGSQMDLTIKANLDGKIGPLNFDLSSTNVKASAFANILENAITLKEPFIATLKTTSSPLFHNITTKNPIVLRINDNNFSLPINPLDTKRIKVGYGMLDLGILTIENTGDLATLMEMMKNNPKNVDIWFCPIEFSIIDGVANIQRTDMLINYQMQLCYWGQYNFLDDKANMYLGLTSQALYAALGVSGLSQDYVIKIPVHGSINALQIDASDATSKITALMTAKATNKAGILGSIIGSIARGAMKSDDNIPPPKKPFPWEGKVNLPTPPASNQPPSPLPFNLF